MLTLALLTGCGLKTEEKSLLDLDVTQIQAESEIETVEGTPAEKVDAYTEKAEEAQAKLQLLLESKKAEQAESEESSFINLIPTAFAQDDSETASTADEIAELLAEIQTYTELAAEAATEETDPAGVAALLEAVQETQIETADLLDGASGDIGEAANAVIEEVAGEIDASIEEVDAAVAEVNSALESGASEVQIDIETDVEDFLAEGVKKIRIKDRLDHQKMAERKVQRAKQEIEKVKQKLVENEVPQEEADQVLAELQQKFEESNKLLEEGKFKEATKFARESKREGKQIKNVVARAQDAKQRFAELKQLAEDGDPVAAEKLDNLKPLVEEGKQFKEVLDNRREVHKEFLEEVKAERAEFKQVRRDIDQELYELKKLEALGEITSEEFTAEKGAIFEKKQVIQKERIQVQEQVRSEHIDLLNELKGLPLEEIQAKKRELEGEKQERGQAIRRDQKKLNKAIQTGDEEAVEAIKVEITEGQEEVREQRQEKVQEFVLNKIEQLPPEKQEALKERHENLKAVQEERQELRKELRDQSQEGRTEIQEDKKLLRESIQSGDEAAVDAARETIQIDREEYKEERKDIKQLQQNERDALEGVPAPLKKLIQDDPKDLKDRMEDIRKQIKVPKPADTDAASPGLALGKPQVPKPATTNIVPDRKPAQPSSAGGSGPRDTGAQGGVSDPGPGRGNPKAPVAVPPKANKPVGR